MQTEIRQTEIIGNYYIPLPSMPSLSMLICIEMEFKMRKTTAFLYPRYKILLESCGEKKEMLDRISIFLSHFALISA